MKPLWKEVWERPVPALSQNPDQTWPFPLFVSQNNLAFTWIKGDRSTHLGWADMTQGLRWGRNGEMALGGAEPARAASAEQCKPTWEKKVMLSSKVRTKRARSPQVSHRLDTSKLNSAWQKSDSMFNVSHLIFTQQYWPGTVAMLENPAIRDCDGQTLPTLVHVKATLNWLWRHRPVIPAFRRLRRVTSSRTVWSTQQGFVSIKARQEVRHTERKYEHA